MPLRETFDFPAETPYSYRKQAGVNLIVLKGNKCMFIVLENCSTVCQIEMIKLKRVSNVMANTSTNNW